MKTIKSKLMVVVISLAAATSIAIAAPTTSSSRSASDAQMENKVRKDLVTLPYYGVFDNLAYQVNGNTVTLYGQVVRPITRKDAERRVARIEGVDRVINNIEVLPVSGFDDSIRARTYRAVFRSGSLYRYAMGANPSIHIIVKGGHVTLEGVVSSQMDSQLAYMAANGVPGVFSVTNNLRLASRN
ncbi:MAG TPA: BON domain-containing protein [Blastocatellia bacterium]|nr:BON domain-containing protein [Blastocatellia bacterium]